MMTGTINFLFPLGTYGMLDMLVIGIVTVMMIIIFALISISPLPTHKIAPVSG